MIEHYSLVCVPAYVYVTRLSLIYFKPRKHRLLIIGFAPQRVSPLSLGPCTTAARAPVELAFAKCLSIRRAQGKAK